MATSTISPRRLALGLAILLSLSIAFYWRWLALERSLWYDELYSIKHFMSGSLWSSLSTYKAANNHILNSLFANALSRYVDGSLGYRIAPFLLGFIGVSALTLIAWYWSGGEQAFIATTLAATLPGHISCSAETRGYAGASLACLAIITSFRLSTPLSAPLLFFSVLAALLFHPASLLVTLGAAAGWFGTRPWVSDPQRWRSWLLGHAVAFLLYLKVLKRVWSFARRNVAQNLEFQGLEVFQDLLRSISVWELSPPILGIAALLLVLGLDRIRVGGWNRPSEELRWRQALAGAFFLTALFWFIPGTFRAPRFGLVLALPAVLTITEGLFSIRARSPFLAVIFWSLLVSAQARVAMRWSSCELQAVEPALRVALRRSKEQGLPLYSAGLGAELVGTEVPRSLNRAIVIELFSGTGGHFEKPQHVLEWPGLRARVRVFELGGEHREEQD